MPGKSSAHENTILQPGEQDALIAYGDFVESVRQWGRTEREKIGL